MMTTSKRSFMMQRVGGWEWRGRCPGNKSWATINVHSNPRRKLHLSAPHLVVINGVLLCSRSIAFIGANQRGADVGESREAILARFCAVHGVQLVKKHLILLVP